MTKTVALADDAYDALARLKAPGESFSDVVRRLAGERRPGIRDVAGGLAHDSDYWKAFAAERRNARRVNLRRVRFEDP